MESGAQRLLQQAVQEIEVLIRKSIDSGRLVIDGSADEIDKAMAEQSIRRACMRTVVLLEQFADSHRTLLNEARKIQKLVKAEPLKVEEVEGEFYLVLPFEIREIINIFKSLHFEKDKEAVPEIAPLLDVLGNTEYYITSSNIFGKVPRSEADVHERIEGLLKCLYKDVLRKPRLSKPIKGFEPDTGIPSLKTLIDYKFVTSSEDGKRIIDEILADIGGYQSRDYDKFVFVIYETSRVIPVDEWIQAVEASKPRNPIKIVVLKGVAATGKEGTKKQNGK